MGLMKVISISMALLMPQGVYLSVYLGLVTTALNLNLQVYVNYIEGRFDYGKTLDLDVLLFL